MRINTFVTHFADITDPRQLGKVEHKLFDIILLTISAVISGAEGWEDIEMFGEERLDWLRLYGDFDNGIPAHDTIARVISRIEPKELQSSFIKWMQNCQQLTEGSVIAIDGKTVRRSFDKKQRKAAIHMVSAFSAANSLVLGQVKTDAKSNEITAIPELLQLLEIKGCLVSIDAMGCQRNIADKIVKKEGDYLLAVKGNQPKLQAAFEKHFPLPKLSQYDGDRFETKEKAHGRTEHRMYFVADIFEEFVDFSFEWPELKTVGAAVSIRQVGDKPPRAEDIFVRYYISSAELSAKEFGEAVRSHWSIENTLHWVLDVTMREDDSRIRRGDAAENLAGIKHIGLNLLRQETSLKLSVKKKRLKAALNEQYLSKVIEI